MQSFKGHPQIAIHSLRRAACEAERPALAEWNKQGKEKKPAAVG
ncbi:hypothetical protein LARV_00909 [Longilinea arvoryzae]|uniref:Uncharacterized protein n=1 Tax=Longilinea arvoryzae TaxID=360412 RepID=A0A0S7BFA7_9CHLR|nr:hypothetical protein LARV_00909 [Longilinea arvoryzae]